MTVGESTFPIGYFYIISKLNGLCLDLRGDAKEAQVRWSSKYSIAVMGAGGDRTPIIHIYAHFLRTNSPEPRLSWTPRSPSLLRETLSFGSIRMVRFRVLLSV